MTAPFQYPDPSRPPDQSAPFHYPDYNATLGVDSPLAASEWDTMQQRKNQLVAGIIDRMNLANSIGRVDPSIHLQPGGTLGAADHVVNQHQQDGTNADGSPTQFQDMMTPPHQEELNQLIGAAKYWGIENADRIPPSALKKIVEAKRLSAEGEGNGLNPAADIALTAAAAAGLGATQTLVELAQHIPFIGSAIAHNAGVQKTSQWLAGLDEGVQAGMTQDERKGYRIAHGLGGAIGFAVPGEAAWSIAGAVGRLGVLSGGVADAAGGIAAFGRIASPIGRAAMQGAVASWLLEGGGDQSNQEAAIKVGMGAAGGAAFHVVSENLPRVFEKVRSAFKARSDPFVETPMSEGRAQETEDADWWFAADREIPGTSTNQRQLTAGSTPVDPTGPAPVGWTQPEPQGPAGEPFQQPDQLVDVSRRLMSPDRAATTEKILGLTEQRDVARRLMETDALTGAGNKMALNRAMDTVDNDPSLGWAVFDGKQFKAVNDAHGHQVGDQVLQNFHRALVQTAQEMQIPARVFRQGGDEFAAVVPHDQLDAFTRRATELSEQVVGGVRTKLDGYAHGQFGEADLELMRNKQLGRSQITEGNLDIPESETGVGLARSEAAALTKQAVLMEGVTVPELAHSTEIDESDVVKAALFQNPERINVIQGVGDIGTTVRKLTQGMVEGRIMPHQFRLVERGGQMDLLVSDGLAITPKRVAQYKEHGFFDGQQVTVNGRPLEIKNVAGPRTDIGMARVYDPYSEESYLVPHHAIQPGRHTGSDVEGLSEHGDQLYGRFQQYVQGYMETEAAKMPAGATVDTGWTSTETSSQLPRLLDSFLSQEVGSSPLSRAAVESYFNVRRVQDFQAMAPEETAHLRAVSADLTRARAENPVEYSSTEDLASHKGMRYLAASEGDGVLVDVNSDLRVPVASEEAAQEFLMNFNRDMPDYSPMSEVPVEVAGTNPHAANPGETVEPLLEGGAEDHSVYTNEAAADVEDTVAALGGDTAPVLTQPLPAGGGGSYTGAGPGAAGGGNAGGPPPPPPSVAATRGPNPVPPNPPAVGLGQQFATLRRTNPQALHQAMSRFDSAWFNLMTPFRSAVLALESDLKGVGVNQGTIWKHYQDVVNQRVMAHNEALPWHAEYADIMSQFKRTFLRDGEVMRNHLIVNAQAKTTAMNAAGYTPQEIAAQFQVDDFFDRFLSQHTGDPIAGFRVNAYLSDVRQRQAMNLPNPFGDQQGRLGPDLDWFQKMVKGTNMQLRQMDARMLGQKMVRAAMFDKHVEPAFQTMRSEWNQAGVPQEFKDFVNDWLDVVKTGHNPGYDVMVHGVRHTLNALGVPITNGEVSTLGSVAFSNMYRAQIGGRPDAIFRDSIQPFFSGVRIGFAPTIRAYQRFLTGGQTTRDMIDRGMRGGWLEKGLTRVANADVFEAQQYDPLGQQILTPKMQARRDMLAKLGDLTWAMTPKALRNGLQGTRLDPLHYYTKLGEVNRLISGDSGWELADRALSTYQRDMTQLMANNNPTPQQLDDLMKKLVSESKANVYPQPIQDEFQRLVKNGDMEQAAFLMGNEAANMQFRYGALENPVGIRKMGFTGKAIMQFGTFTQQYVAQMREMASSPGIPAVEKAKMLTRYGTVSAALGLASAYTGWNFGKWAWHQSLTFAGGPLFQAAYQGLQTVSGEAASAMGMPLSPDQKAATRTPPSVGGVLGAIAGAEFPYSSSFRTLGNVYQTSTGMNPIEGTARTLITGETTLQPDIAQWSEQMGARAQANADSIQAGLIHPVLGHQNIAAYNPADSARPGMTRYNQNGYPVYNSMNVDRNGQVPTHRLDVPSGRLPTESWEQYEQRVLSRTDFPNTATRATNDPNLLHPEVRDSLMKLMAAASQDGVPLRINETARSQDRQEYLFQQGRTQPGSVVTWTLTSDHATNRAADLEPVGKNPEAGWNWIQQNAPQFGFNVMGARDPGHVSMPLAGGGYPQSQPVQQRGYGGGKGGQQ